MRYGHMRYFGHVIFLPEVPWIPQDLKKLSGDLKNAFWDG